MIAFLIGILATWRIARLLFWERGPYAVFKRLRDHFGVVEYQTPDGSWERDMDQTPTEIGKGLCCFWCTAVWSALAVNVLEDRRCVSPVKVLAYSAGAIFLGFLHDRLEK